MSNISDIKINDDIACHTERAIEVVVQLSGESRYCYFATPDGLRNFGDWIPGTNARIHYDDNDLIIVSEISEEIIVSAIHAIEEEGRLTACTSM